MAVTLKIENNIGTITFDQEDSKVNILTSEVIKTLDGLLDEVSGNKDLTALIILSNKKNIFIAGADIKEIERIIEVNDGQAKSKAGQDVLNKLEDLSLPTVAVIDGVALGGGCELALACNYRLATFNEKIRIGLPEVNLGFVPGFGGTYRLPRLIGLSEGIKMILAGRPVPASKALRVGLVDRLVTQKGLEEHIDKFLSDIHQGIVKNKFPRKKKKGFPAFLDKCYIGHWIIFDQSRKSVFKLTKGFYPAPLKAIDVVKKNFYTNRSQGMEIESIAFSKLAVTDISKNLVQVYYMSEKYKKLQLEGCEDKTSRHIDKCGILGAGIMGGGIAQLLSSKGIWSRLKDIGYEQIALGFQAAAKVYSQAVKKRKLKKAEAQEKMAHITATLDYKGFDKLDIVIEAVVENLEIKKKVFKELSDVTPEWAVLATNTSALSVTEMAKETQDPSRVIGLHFFNPVHRMPLVEIITTPMTSGETIMTTLNLAKRLGKIPIIVKDSYGFVVNRILLGYINEAGRLLEKYGELERIDKLMTDFGMPMGPFLLSDEVGLDVGIKVMRILEKGLGDRFKPVDIFEKVYKKGYLGKKSGKGYYIHSKKRRLNEEVITMLSSSSGTQNSSAFDSIECSERLIYIMINEAAKCLEDGIVDDPAAIDVGMIFGTGFPPFRGGLLRYADSIGLDKVVKKLEGFEKKWGGQRFKPSSYLLTLRDKEKGFSNEKK